MYRTPHEKIVELKKHRVFSIAVSWYSQVCQGVATDTEIADVLAFLKYFLQRRPNAAGEVNGWGAAAERKVRA